MAKELPTISVHGKEYVLVKDRILAFHELHTAGEIQTEITINGNSVLAKAIVKTDGRTFTGHSEAVRSEKSGITGQSPVEVAETSAVGRALGMLGIGILESVASADEIRKAPQTSQLGDNFHQEAKAHASQALNGPKCVHGAMDLKVSKSAKNPNREYYACPMQKKNEQCAMDKGGFIWADQYVPAEPIIDEDGDEIKVARSIEGLAPDGSGAADSEYDPNPPF